MRVDATGFPLLGCFFILLPFIVILLLECFPVTQLVLCTKPLQRKGEREKKENENENEHIPIYTRAQNISTQNAF